MQLKLAAVLSLTAVAQASYLVRTDFFCCPKTSSNGVALTHQQPGPFALICEYGDIVCKYAAGTGHAKEAENCPAEAVANPSHSKCA